MRAMRKTALLIAALTVLAGCNGGGDGGETTGADDEGRAVTIIATDYEFDAPAEIDGGIVTVTLDNQGEQPHEAAFIQVDEDYDLASFATDFKPILEGGPIPATFQTVVALSEAPGGETAEGPITLPAGTWVLFCALEDEDDEGEQGEGAASEEAEPAAVDKAEEGAGAEPEDGAAEDAADEEGQMHFERGMLELVTVTGGEDVSVDDMPENDGVVTSDDYSFALPELGAGEHTLTFTNASDEQMHHGVFFEFAEGVDEAAARDTFQKMIAAGEGPPPEGVTPPEEAGYAPVTGPGMATTFPLELKAGRTYAAVCFIQDREGGPPHAAAHNMVGFFTVS